MSEGGIPSEDPAASSEVIVHKGVTRHEGELDQDVALRKQIADRGNFSFVGRFSEGGVAWASVDSDAYHPFHKAVLLDREGVLIADEEFSSTGNFSEGLAVTDYGYVDENGKIVLPRGKFSTRTLNVEDGDFKEGLASVNLADNFRPVYIFINREGNSPFDGRFTQASPFSEGAASVKEEEYFGFIDKEGNWIMRDLARTSSFDSGVASIQESFVEPFFIIDRDGKKIPTEAPVICIGPFSEGVAWATDGRRLLLLDSQGKIKLEAQDYIAGTPGDPASFLYNLPKPVRNGMSLAQFMKGTQTLAPSFMGSVKDEKGFIDTRGRRYGPYSNAGQFVDGFGLVETGNKYKGFKKYFIDKNGNRVPEFHKRETEGAIKRSAGDLLSDLSWRLRNRNRK